MTSLGPAYAGITRICDFVFAGTADRGNGLEKNVDMRVAPGDSVPIPLHMQGITAGYRTACARTDITTPNPASSDTAAVPP
jgi:hypothetical protein